MIDTPQNAAVGIDDLDHAIAVVTVDLVAFEQDLMILGVTK